jgi:hypothetical protein
VVFQDKVLPAATDMLRTEGCPQAGRYPSSPAPSTYHRDTAKLEKPRDFRDEDLQKSMAHTGGWGKLGNLTEK